MTQHHPDPRRDEEHAALRACLDAILAVHADTCGYIHVWQRKGDGTSQWLCQRMPEFASAFLDEPWELINGFPAELYFRQHSYHLPWWKAGSVKHTPVAELRCVAIDLDGYARNPPLPVREAVDGALRAIEEAGLPAPNHIDYSGDGVNGGAYVRWLIEPLAADTNLERYRDRRLWQETMSVIIALLGPYGADRNAADLARWLRVPGSINAKYLDVGNGGPSFRDTLHDARINLEDLAHSLEIHRLTGEPPAARRDYRAPLNRPAESVQSLSNTQRRHPHQIIVDALERLNHLRRGLREGHRNAGLYQYVVHLNGGSLAEDRIRERACDFAGVFRPPLPDADVERTISSALRYTPFRTSYRGIIEHFDITSAEQADLGIEAKPAIHDADGNLIEENRDYHREDARNRNLASRRRKGAKPKAEINAKRQQAITEETRKKIETVLSRFPPGMRPKVSRLAKLIGAHRNTITKYLNETEKK